MKLVVLDMSRYKLLSILFLLFFIWSAKGQYKYEREYRIKKNQFPTVAHAFIEDQLKDARRIRYYRETDSTKVSYEAKFKLDKLHYSVEFDEQGNLEDVEILIKEVDIPNDTFAAITAYLESNFTKYRILRIQQQYPVNENETVEETLKNAFQNLLLPTIRYEIMVAAKKDNGFEDYEILFDHKGEFIKLRKSLPLNHDHILY